MRTNLFTRNRAEAWRAAQPLPAPPPAKPSLSPGLLKASLTLLGAVLLGIAGACLHH